MDEKNFECSCIPSGMTPDKFKDLGFLIVDEKNRIEEVVELADGVTVIKLKTHSIYLGRMQHLGEGALSIDLFERGNYFDGDIPRMLASYAYLKEKNLKIQPGGPSETTSDSGVYQSHQKGTTIEVEKLAEYYNQNGDEGIVVDEILSGAAEIDPNAQREMAIHQKERTDLLKSSITRSDFRLINVVQGSDHQTQKRWLELVWDEELSDMALGSRVKKIVPMLPIIAELIFEKGVRRIHLLGVNGHSQLLLMALISEYVDITSDGSEVTQFMYAQRKYLTLLPEGRLHVTAVGQPNSEDTLKALHGQTNCGCKACKLVPLLEAYQSNNPAIQALLLIHNQLNHQAFIAKWVAAIRKNAEEAFERYVRVFGGEKNAKNYQKRLALRRDFLVTRNFLAYAASHGAEAAIKKFAAFFS